MGQSLPDDARPGEQFRALVALLVRQAEPQLLDPLAQSEENFYLRPREVGEAVHEGGADVLERPAPATRQQVARVPGAAFEINTPESLKLLLIAPIEEGTLAHLAVG